MRVITTSSGASSARSDASTRCHLSSEPLRFLAPLPSSWRIHRPAARTNPIWYSSLTSPHTRHSGRSIPAIIHSTEVSGTYLVMPGSPKLISTREALPAWFSGQRAPENEKALPQRGEPREDLRWHRPVSDPDPA